jgi:hypothetical protein
MAKEELQKEQQRTHKAGRKENERVIACLDDKHWMIHAMLREPFHSCVFGRIFTSRQKITAPYRKSQRLTNVSSAGLPAGCAEGLLALGNSSITWIVARRTTRKNAVKTLATQKAGGPRGRPRGTAWLHPMR